MVMDHFERKAALIGIVEQIIEMSKTKEGRSRSFRVTETVDRRTGEVMAYFILMDGDPFTRNEMFTLNDMVHGADCQIDYSEDNQAFSQVKLIFYKAPPIPQKRTFRTGWNMGRPPKRDDD